MSMSRIVEIPFPSAVFLPIHGMHGRTDEWLGHPHKKRYTQTLLPKNGSTCTFAQPYILFFAMEALYNYVYHEHTPRGRGLAMVARQSCIAGPSVFSTSYHV
jgi:hypothetical protein